MIPFYPLPCLTFMENTSEPTLFDTPADIEEATNDGIDAAAQHANAEWKTAVLGGISWIAQRMPEFTSDHVHQYMAKHHPDLETHDTRAIGGIMRIAKTQGWIEPTGRYEKSRRKEAHSNPKAVWKSLLWTGQEHDNARTL